MEMLALVKAQIEKGTLSPYSQDSLTNYVSNMMIGNGQQSNKNELRLSAKQEVYLEFYSKELIEAHDYILNHQLDSRESQLQYLQEKSFFKDYPRIRPEDVYNKIMEMDKSRREEKVREALRELINSNSLTNG